MCMLLVLLVFTDHAPQSRNLHSVSNLWYGHVIKAQAQQTTTAKAIMNISPESRFALCSKLQMSVSESKYILNVM